MSDTTLIAIIIASGVGVLALIVLVLSFTLTPERAESLGVVFQGLSTLIQGVRGKGGGGGEEVARASNAQGNPAAKPVAKTPVPTVEAPQNEGEAQRVTSRVPTELMENLKL